MPDFDPEAFGSRLRSELAERGWDVKELQQKVREASGGARGTSYGSVWSYVNGHAPLEPRREVVEAFAELLDVLPDYLLFGGPKTREEEALRREQEQEEPDAYEQIRAIVPGLAQLDYNVAVAFMTHLRRWTSAHLRAGYQVEMEDVEEYAASVWEYLHEPFHAWSRRIGKQVPINALGTADYMTTMLSALNISLHLVAPAGVSYEQVEAWPDLEDSEGREKTDD